MDEMNRSISLTPINTTVALKEKHDFLKCGMSIEPRQFRTYSRKRVPKSSPNVAI
ncbi:MAG: hypothetical protein JNK90_04785 [Planctomycetaceae bacterium]|nr:hypothetical protein [Planctomycetaceae bacterium]